MAASVALSRRTFLKGSSLAVAALGATPGGTQVASPKTHESRLIPGTNERIPVIGMGTWQTFDPPSLTPAALEPLQRVLEIFHAAGGRVVDTSPMYGKSEHVTGMLSSRLGVNAGLFLATKVWTSGEAAGMAQMTESFSLLQRQRLDLIQVHNLVDVQTQLATLRRFKAEGRVRYLGITHYQVSAFPELERVMRREKPDFVQLPYSVVTRQAEQHLLPAAADLGIAVLVNRPFESGELFRKLKGVPVPDWAQRSGTSWAQLFLKFILAHPAVTCVLPATDKPRHIEDNLAAGSGEPLSGDVRDKLAAFVAS